MIDIIAENHIPRPTQLSLSPAQTKNDYIEFARSPVIEQIFGFLQSSESDAKVNTLTQLRQSILLGRSVLGVLMSDRNKRYAAHQQTAELLSLDPLVRGAGERNIRSRHVLGLSKEFFTSLARLGSPIDVGIAVGHQEHAGDTLRPIHILTEEMEKNPDETGLHEILSSADKAIATSEYTVSSHSSVGHLAPHVTFEEFTPTVVDDVPGVSIFKIHKKSPLRDIVPNPDLLPHIRQIDLYERAVYAGLTVPGHTPVWEAVREYLTDQNPDGSEMNREDIGLIVPLSTSVILLARPYRTDMNI